MTNRFRTARKAIPMTQAHLAQAAGVTERTIRSLEKGETVSPETVQAVNAVLGLTAETGADRQNALNAKANDGTNGNHVPMEDLKYIMIGHKVSGAVDYAFLLLSRFCVASLVVGGVLCFLNPALLFPLTIGVVKLIFFYLILSERMNPRRLDPTTRSELLICLVGISCISAGEMSKSILSAKMWEDGIPFRAMIAMQTYTALAGTAAAVSALLAAYTICIDRCPASGTSLPMDMWRGIRWERSKPFLRRLMSVLVGGPQPR